MNIKNIAIKSLWAILVIIFVAIATRDRLPSNIAKYLNPKIAYTKVMQYIDPLPIPLAMIPAPTYEVKPFGNPKGKQKNIEIFDSPPAVGAALAAQKDWIDYVDKFIAWIAALAGAYKLFQRAPQSAPVHVPPPIPVITMTPAPALGKPKKPRKRAKKV